MTIRLLLADDSPLIRRGLRLFLEPQSDLEIVGEARHGAEAIELARTLRPHVVVMDIRMPIMDGLTATRRLTEELPAICVLILSAIDGADAEAEARAAGAAAFLSKYDSSLDLLGAIRAATRPPPRADAAT